MISATELNQFPIFTTLTEEWRRRIADTAAELVVEPGEWIVREGEAPSFFVLLNGALTCEKDYGGTHKVCARYVPGDFYGEIPILLDSVCIASLQAVEASRLLRLDRLEFKDMVASSTACNEMVVEVMTRRLKMIRDHMRSNESIRVHVVGSKYDPACTEVRSFLSQNHISYRWSDHGAELQNTRCHDESFAVIDGANVIACPLTVRAVAEGLGMKTRPGRSEYDLVIVGGGPTGLAAAVNAASEGLEVLLLEKNALGGQAACSTRIENYPGFPSGISGDELGSKAVKQAAHFGSDIVVTREVRRIEPAGQGYCIEIEGNHRVQSASILLATGVEWRKLSANGVSEFTGKGVFYGAARAEGNTLIGKRVYIVGGGNSAGQAAMFFSGFAASVTLLVRGASLEESMSRYLIDQLRRRANVQIETRTEICGVDGDSHLERLITRKIDKTQERPADALFVMIGAIANTQWMPASLQRDPDGFVYTGRDVSGYCGSRSPSALETSMPGIFCAGDVRHGSIKRVASGMGEGSMVVAFVHQYLAELGQLDAVFA